MQRLVNVFCVAMVAVTLIGCSSGTAEIKPVDKPKELTEAQKKDRDEQIKKSMERSGYSGRNVTPQPGQ